VGLHSTYNAKNALRDTPFVTYLNCSIFRQPGAVIRESLQQRFKNQHANVHSAAILITVQRDATQRSLFIILQVHSTFFGCQPHPSSGVHKTVTTASGTGHILCATTSLQRD